MPVTTTETATGDVVGNTGASRGGDDRAPENTEDAGDSYDEEEDDDYDPAAKQDAEAEADAISDDEADGAADGPEVSAPDYSKIQLTTSQVQTRRQRQEQHVLQQTSFIGNFETDSKGLVRAPPTDIDVDALFNDLKAGAISITKPEVVPQATSQPVPVVDTADSAAPTITILTSYSFAGKLVTETKVVDANSAEARAYMNSTSAITAADMQPEEHRSHVMVMRKIQGTDTEVPLRIKLKRPSLVDKFLATVGSKLQKLSTLEKSRLDWASFVDNSKIKDDLAIHNRGGYLEKQSFLDRIQSKRDAEFKRAQAADKQQQRALENK